jgi:aryl-alcohol dehydrogenase-like predicted oxidoreductase/NAD-dependent dihydropyrimidine dehydrogenase PreA subunit
MEKRNLGKTGIKVSRLIFGTLPMGGLQAGLTPKEGGRLIRLALEAGVNAVDTAEMYGTYGHVKEGLRGFSGEAFVITKTHAASGEDARGHVEKALRELGREYLDVVHIHGARLSDPVNQRAEVLAELVKMKGEGKLRFAGCSSHYVSAFESAAGCPDIDVVHPLVNVRGLGIKDGSAGEMALAIRKCSEAGKGVYAMKALAGGNLIGEARSALRWVLGLEGLDAVAVGMLSEEEVKANAALFDGLSDDPKLWGELEKRERRFKIMEVFCKGCGSCVTACPSGALSLKGEKAVVDEKLCVLCGYCAAACPDFLIRVI